MDESHMLTEAQLAKLWRISWATLFNWRQAGILTADMQDNKNPGATPRYFYAPSSIDRIHRQGARNFTRYEVPGIQELVRVPKSLRRSTEVADLLAMPRNTIIKKVEAGQWPAIILPRARIFRFPMATIQQMRTDIDSGVDMAIASHVLCLDPTTIRDLTRRHKLQRIVGRNDSFLVSRDSFLALVRTMVHNITPEEWWRQRDSSGETLIPRAQISKDYGIPCADLQKLLAEQPIPYIQKPGGYALLPESSAREVLAEWRLLLLADILRVLPCEPAVIAHWMHRKHVCAQIHQKAGVGCHSITCLLAYITAQRTSNTFTADEWLAHCLQDGATPVLANQLADMSAGAEVDDVLADVDRKLLRGVRLPDDNVAIMHGDAVAWRRRRERGLEGGGYYRRP